MSDPTFEARWRDYNDRNMSTGRRTTGGTVFPTHLRPGEWERLGQTRYEVLSEPSMTLRWLVVQQELGVDWVAVDCANGVGPYVQAAVRTSGLRPCTVIVSGDLVVPFSGQALSIQVRSADPLNDPASAPARTPNDCRPWAPCVSTVMFGRYVLPYWSDRPVSANPEPGRCPTCWKPDPDFAHGVLEGVAVMLAEPLRRALDRHIEDHGCGTPDHPNYAGGVLRCREAARLFGLLPPGDQILVG